MIKSFDTEYILEIVDMFCDIYSNEPFCYKWIDENRIFQYFADMSRCPDFKGFIYERDEKLSGACFGEIKRYFPNTRYCINEIFIKREFQSQGFGTEFMNEISQSLKRENTEIIELTTQKTIPAYEFYKKNGFCEGKNSVYMLKSLLSQK
jgi:aminoglycoside 6'-N-acetyltransferase I